jgi:hypothetical protein
MITNLTPVINSAHESQRQSVLVDEGEAALADADCDDGDVDDAAITLVSVEGPTVVVRDQSLSLLD